MKGCLIGRLSLAARIQSTRMMMVLDLLDQVELLMQGEVRVGCKYSAEATDIGVTWRQGLARPQQT